MSLSPKITHIGPARIDPANEGAQRPSSPTARPPEPSKPADDSFGVKDFLEPKAARTTIYVVAGVVAAIFALILLSLFVNSIMDFKMNSEQQASVARDNVTPEAARPQSAPAGDNEFEAAQKKLGDAFMRMKAQQGAPAPTPQPPAPTAFAAAPPVTGAAPPVAALAVVTPDPQRAEPPPKAEVARTEPPPAPAVTADEVSRALLRASSLIREGQVASARALLERASRSNDPAVAFALAETYDPKTLARWKTIGVAADPARARSLYRAALDGGVSEARNRLDQMER